MTNIFVVCPEHGDIFVHRGAGMADRPDYRQFQPVREDVRAPQATDPPACPLCDEPLRYEERA